MLKKISIIFLVFAAIYLIATYFLSGLILFTPDRDIATVYQMNEERWNLDLDSLRNTLPGEEEVSFISPQDSITLNGWLYRPDTVRCGVIFAHGYSVNRANMLKYTPIFDSCGCALLLYDHRGHGTSAPEAFGSGGYHESTDFLAAHDFLKRETGLVDKQIGWFGESWGGATVLLAASRQDKLLPAWVVSESAYADWETAVMERGLKQYGEPLRFLSPGAFWWTGFRADFDFYDASPVAMAPKITVPTMIIHSATDQHTGAEQFDQLAAAIPAELLTANKYDWGAWHAHNIIWRREQYTNDVLAFIDLATGGEFCQIVDR